MSKVFVSIGFDTKQPVQSFSELKQLAKDLRKEIENVKPGEIPATQFKAMQERLRLANTEVQNFNQHLKATPTFTQKLGDAFTQSFMKVGAMIASVFATQKIFEFGKEAVKAFNEAELNAKKLKTAVSASGGLQVDYEKLINQSVKLQKTTIFSDDTIQQVQTAALQFGLTSDAVEKLIPTITDFASATGQDLQSALESVLKGIEGSGKGLKLYGIELSQGQTRSENFAQITEQLTKKFEGQAEVVGGTATGNIVKLKNAYNDLQEQIGEKLSGAVLRVAGDLTKLFTSAEKTVSPFQKLNNEFTIEIETLKRGNLGNEQRKMLIDEINKKYGEYLPNLLTEKSSLNEISKAQEEVNKQLLGRVLLESQKEDLTKLAKNQIGAQRGLLEIEKERIKIEGDYTIEQNVRQHRLQQLTIGEGIHNAVLEHSKKQISELTIEYDKLAKQLGIVNKEKNGIEGLTKDEQKKRNAEAIANAKDVTEYFKNLNEESYKRVEDNILKESALRIENATQTGERISKIQEDELQKRIDNAKDFGKETGKLEEQLAKLKKDNGEKEVADAKANAKSVTDAFKPQADKQTEYEKQQSELRKEFRKQEVEFAVQAFQMIMDASLQSSRNETEAKLRAIDETTTAQLEAIDIAQSKEENSFVQKTATQLKYDAERRKVQDKANAETKKLKTEQAQKEKEAAIINSIINTAQAVVAALAQFPGVPFTIPFAVLAGALGIAQTAIIAAQPIPKFKRGIALDNPMLPGTETSDSIPAFLSKGESVINAKSTRMFKPLLSHLNQMGGGVGFANGVIDFGNANYSVPNFASTFNTNNITNNRSSTQTVQVENKIDFELMKDFLQTELSKPRRGIVVGDEVARYNYREEIINRRAQFNTSSK